MKVQLIIPTLSLALFVAVSGCSRSDSTSEHSITASGLLIATNSDGIKALAKLDAQQVYRARIDPMADYYDAVYFVDKHRDEIVSTFQVADVVELSNSAVALTRFSIGGTIYHKPIWFSKQDDRWLISMRQYVDAYNLGPLKTEDTNKVADVIQKVGDWKKDGGDLWFWEY